MINIDLTQLSIDELEQLQDQINQELDSRDDSLELDEVEELDEDIDQEAQKEYDRQSYVPIDEYIDWVNEMISTSQLTPTQGQALIKLQKHTLATL